MDEDVDSNSGAAVVPEKHRSWGITLAFVMVRETGNGQDAGTERDERKPMEHVTGRVKHAASLGAVGMMHFP